jgi:hypothetical protein
MAVSKRTKTRNQSTSSRRVLRFPEAKGKIIAEVEVSLSPDHNIIEIVFEDKTALNFELEPCFTVFPETTDWRSGEYKPIRRWRPVHCMPSR